MLAGYLDEHLSLFGFLEFFLLFIPVWWTWICTISFASRFGTDDVSTQDSLTYADGALEL